MKTAADVLRGAAQVLDEDGWCQDESVDDSGRRCAMGAIDKAAAQLGASRGEARMALWEARSCLRRMVGVLVADWNDTPGRTADEVKAALLAAAERAEAGA